MQLTKEWVASKLPKRPKDANKGTFGKVLVIAGSEHYPGAAYLACAACYRVGAGLVTLATEESVKIKVFKKLPEVTFIVLPEETIYEKLYEYDAILIGPGLGIDNFPPKRNFVNKILGIHNLPPTVIDGDGLNILSKIDKWWAKLKANCVLTPHPGEMSRLTVLSIEEIQSQREDIARRFAQKWKQIVILKGANTVVSSLDGQVGVSPFANPALATAGTGDVLSGIIAGFLAQGLNPFDAASVGVYVHGLAGEMLREKYGDAGGLASDLSPLIPKALLHISKHWVS